MVLKYFFSFLSGPNLKPPGPASARGADSAPHSAPEAPGQDGRRAKLQRCIYSAAAAPAQRPPRPQHAGQGFFPKPLLQPTATVCPCIVVPSSLSSPPSHVQPFPSYTTLSFIKTVWSAGIARLSCSISHSSMGFVAPRTVQVASKSYRIFILSHLSFFFFFFLKKLTQACVIFVNSKYLVPYYHFLPTFVSSLINEFSVNEKSSSFTCFSRSTFQKI